MTAWEAVQKMSEEEKRLRMIEHRRAAAEWGTASCSLEGVVISPENVWEKKLEERWIIGEITNEEYLNAPAHPPVD